MSAPFLLNNVPTQDNYTEQGGATIKGGPQFVRFSIQIYGAAVGVEIQQADGSWAPEFFLGPVVGPLNRVGIGIRFRSWVPGASALVSVDCLTSSEVVGGQDSLAPQNFALTPSGEVVAVGTFLGSFDQAHWPPTPPANKGDFADFIDPTYGGVSWNEGLEYRPDVDPNDPWRPYMGAKGGYTSLLQADTSYTGASGWVASGVSLQVPIAGYYAFDVYVFCGNVNQGGSTPSCSAGWSTSNTAGVAPPNSATASIPNVSTILSQGQDLGELSTVALAKGQTVYLMVTATPQAAAHVVTAARMVKVANA